MASMETDFAYLREVVLRTSANVLDPLRDHLFETRLAPLLRARGLQTLGELVALLRCEPSSALRQRVAEAMTVHETSFFRDVRPFELLRRRLIPELMERRGARRRLSLWCGACSTGQEAYSLAMLLRESFPRLGEWNVSILGTDFSNEALSRARQGRYQRIEVNRGLPARSLVRFFVRAGEEWEVVPEIRALCSFRPLNLAAALPFCGLFDGILLRNVMLYLPREVRESLLAEVRRVLAPDGFLLLGSGERPADSERWEAVVEGGTCYYRPRSGSSNPRSQPAGALSRLL